MQVQVLHFGQKKVGHHLTVALSIHMPIRYDSQHIWRITVQWFHQPIKRTKLWLFLDVFAAFAILLPDLHSWIDNSAYIRKKKKKNELRCWTQIFVKKVVRRPTFQESFLPKFCVAVGPSASILAPALFWKASHLNPSAKFCTLLRSRGPIAANGDESIMDGHH